MTLTILQRGGDPVELFGRVNGGLGELDRWFRCNRLTLNLKKTEYVYFSGPGGHAGPPEAGLRIGDEPVRRVEGARFLGVWVDEGLTWTGHIEKVCTKVGQLLGVLWKVGPVLGGRLLLSLYNGLVLPHLQYCLMVWGDFRQGRNGVLGGSLLTYQGKFAGLVAGKRGRYHVTPLLGEYGMLKVGDLYRQQLRVHAWRFWNGKLPENQAAMLRRAADVHRYGTRSARVGLYLSTRDHRSVGYRVPEEWASLPEGQREVGSLARFKRESREGFLGQYRGSVCDGRGCFVCGSDGGRGGTGA